MAWCKLEDTYHDDPKWDELGTRLSVPAMHAAGCVAAMWSWALRHAPDGFLGKMSAKSIARASRWDGDANDFLKASLDSRTIDSSENGYEIHGFAKRSESNKRAQQKRRERRKSERSQTVARPSPDSRGNVVKERRGEEKRGEDIMIVAPPLADAEPTPIGRVRSAWIAAHAARYPEAKAYPWGARESGQAKNLLSSVPLADVLDLIPRYLAWPNARAIRAGHPFGTGPDSFVLKHIELRADLADMGRRGQAATVDNRMRQAERGASTDDAVEEALRIRAAKKAEGEK